MFTLGSIAIPYSVLMLGFSSAVIVGYLVFYGVQLLRPATGQHRSDAPSLWRRAKAIDTVWYETLREDPVSDPFPPPLPLPPPDPYLERFDALLLSTRATFAAIHEFADAGFATEEPVLAGR